MVCEPPSWLHFQLASDGARMSMIFVIRKTIWCPGTNQHEVTGERERHLLHCETGEGGGEGVTFVCP